MNLIDQLATLKKKSLPIGWRLSLWVAFISAILSLAILLSLLPVQKNRVEKEASTDAHILAEAVANIYQHLKVDHPRDQSRQLLLGMARAPHIFSLSVLDQRGAVRYSTDDTELGQYRSTRHRVSASKSELVITHVVTESGFNKIGGVRVVIDRELLLANTHRLLIQIAIGLLLMIFILSILVKGLVERFVSSRLSRLMNLIENAERGSFLIRADIDLDDEIGHVMLGFNQLLGLVTQIEAGHLEEEHRLEDAKVQRSIRQKLEATLFQLERSNERLESKVQAQDLLMEAAHRLSGTLEREAVVERLIGLLQEKLSWPQFAVFLVEGRPDDRHHLKLLAARGFKKDQITRNAGVILGEGVVGIVAQTGAPAVIANLETKDQLTLWEYQDGSLSSPQASEFGSLMAVPMLHKGRVIGAFLFCQPSAGGFDSDDVTLISALGAQTALAIVNAELYETTLELATSDPLTGVLNRRAMVKQIEVELARAQRFNTKVALLLVDVDHFKAYNDRMGHVLGDVALKAIASALKENIRMVDSVARFGGEEFCVILPQADKQAAREVASKLCRQVRSLKLRGTEKQELGYLSVSIGIAVISGEDNRLEPVSDVTDIIALADQALYRAKSLGRDRFVS